VRNRNVSAKEDILQMKRRNVSSFMRLSAGGSRSIVAVACVLIGCTVTSVGTTDDWTTYRSDIRRSGVSNETVGPELYLQWTYTPAHAPRPAWPMPSEEMPRMHSDNAYHVAVAGGYVYFGSSVTGEVHALDSASGTIRWTFFAEGPVRFAPTVEAGRVYFGSDDGCAYCLDADNGAMIWKYRAGPSDEKVIGNGHMISLWPVRTSVLVDNGQAIFCAGVFPYEGIYVCAVDARDGSVLWRNDTIGDRAHELDFGGISPHGHLVASEDIVYVPSGRAMPAAFDRNSGEFLFYASTGGKRGGTWTVLDGDKLVAGVDLSGTPDKRVYDSRSGRHVTDMLTWLPGIDMVLRRDVFYVMTREGVYAIDRSLTPGDERRLYESVNESDALDKSLRALRDRARKADGNAAELINDKIDETVNKLRHNGMALFQRRPLLADSRRRCAFCGWQRSGRRD